MPSAFAARRTVWILMATVRRPWGRAAGSTAGVVFALTPVVVAIARSNNPDMMMVFWLVAAAWAVGRGIDDGRLRWMLLAGVFCGCGFLAKLLAAGMVMPGLWLAYLVAAPIALRGRVACTASRVGWCSSRLLGGWIVAVDAAPLSHRPWIGGSDNGNAVESRCSTRTASVVCSGPAGTIAARDRGGGFGRARVEADPFEGLDDSPGLFRLFDHTLGDQIMWLAPGHHRRRGRRRVRVGTAAPRATRDLVRT